MSTMEFTKHMNYIEPTNQHRRRWASAAIMAYLEAKGDKPYDRETALRDLLTDLHHWSDTNGEDWECELDAADFNYSNERER